MRRIVQYPSNTQYSDVQGHISPAWHQWLRHTRNEPPSLTEQSQDLVRQRNLKILAAQADARWAAKPTYLDAPDKSQPRPSTRIRGPEGYSSKTDTEPHLERGTTSLQSGGRLLSGSEMEGTHSAGEGMLSTSVRTQQPGQVGRNSGNEDTRSGEEQRKAVVMAEEKRKDNPWKTSRGGPSEGWQPEAWNPGPSKR